MSSSRFTMTVLSKMVEILVTHVDLIVGRGTDAMVVGTVADLAFASSTSLSPTAVSPSSRIYIVWMELEPKTSAKRERVWRI